MIQRAKQKYPAHRFHLIQEADLSALQGETFNLVLCLGVLHLSRRWRELIRVAWNHTKNFLLLDMRETHLQSIEDETLCYIKREFC